MASSINAGLERVAKGFVWLVGLVVGLQLGAAGSLLLMNLFESAAPFWWTFGATLVLAIGALLVGVWIVWRTSQKLIGWAVPALTLAIVGMLLSAGFFGGSLIPVAVVDQPFDQVVWQRGCQDRSRLAMLKDLKANHLHVGTTTRTEIESLLGHQRATQGFIYRLDGTTEVVAVPPSEDSFYYCLGPEARLVPIDSWELSLSFDDHGVLAATSESAH